MAGSVGFVGRERELSRLLGALGDDARLVLVVGDAGVGKTRLAGEGMARAAAAGMVAVRGDCLPLAGTLPMLPVAQALAELAGLDDGAVLEAALGSVPEYVRAEVERLLPQLGPGEPDPGGRGEAWQRERLFAAVAELLAAVARRSRVVLVIEDVHWADSATLDCLTFLARGPIAGRVTVVATCRSDEPALAAHVASWLAHMRGSGSVEEIRLGPLSRAEAAEQVAGLAGGLASARLADELYARAEGNPFFTEQLAAAALAGSAIGGLGLLVLPARLAELLVARVGGCGDEARAVLESLAVAGRPLTEDLICGVSGLDAAAVRRGLRELTAAQLLADAAVDRAYRPRHALLAEAVVGGLLHGERVRLHERIARALQAPGGDMLAAEVARHWQAADRPGEELSARIAAAEAAEGVFGYTQAAAHWQRAIELCQSVPGPADTVGIDVPGLYVRAIDALEVSGAGERAAMLAEDAYRRFAGHPDPATAAVIHERAAYYRWFDAPAAAIRLREEALRLFGQAGPSAEHAEAWLYRARTSMFHGEGQRDESLAAFNGALEVAEAAGAKAVVPRILSLLAVHTFLRGQMEEGFALLHRGRALAEALGAGEASIAPAVNESDALLRAGKSDSAAEVALGGLREARQMGREASPDGRALVANAVDALIAQGRTAEAAALIDPLTGPANVDPYPFSLAVARIETDLLRGDIEAAARRQQQISAHIDSMGSIDYATEAGRRAAELPLWAGRPGEALEEVRRVLALNTAPDLTISCGRLLVAGIRACADLAQQARACRDENATQVALDAGGELAAWVGRMEGRPFTDHPYEAAIPAERATWDAERTRLGGASDPDAWSAAAKAWESLGYPHRAGYAWWRQAEAQLDAGQPATAAAAALQAAAAAAQGHAPLLAQIRTLAQRARILLHPPPDAVTKTPPPDALAPYGLTERELTVLQLVAAGRTNAQIGAELFISPRTAGVHVTNILRKLGVSNRVQAAALAERAGLAGTGPA
jgi:ATP/maltotriose-dependent transcriptional regulator MalT